MGKPSTLLFDLIREEHNLTNEDLSKFLIIGDNLETDHMFGKNNQIDSLCVLTGCTTEFKAKRVLVDKVYSEKFEAVPTHTQPYLGYSARFNDFKDFS